MLAFSLASGVSGFVFKGLCGFEVQGFRVKDCKGFGFWGQGSRDSGLGFAVSFMAEKVSEK